jgi:hypothetical protein
MIKKYLDKIGNNFLNNYKILVLIFFILRLYGITDPPLELQHSWRQCTGLMISRNFLTIDGNILYPRIDDLCSSSDIIAFEFQLLSYLHYLISLLFGYEHWYGRLINLIISSIGTISFGYIVSRLFNNKIAWYSVCAILVSSWLIFSRKMMPDTFSVSLVFISFYFAYRYYTNQKWLDILLFFTFFTLGGLVKIPAIIYGFIFLYIIIVYRNKSTSNLFISTILSYIIVFVWYFIWGPYISTKYGNWTNIGMPFLEGIYSIFNNLDKTIHNIIFNSFRSYILFSLFLMCLVNIIIKKPKPLCKPLALIFFFFVLYMFKAGYFFYHHNYYMIPIIPVLAFIIGYGIYHSKNKVILLLFMAGVIESIANQQNDFRIKKSELYKLTLKSKLDSLDKLGYSSKILINTHSNPQQLYLANRKGCYINEFEMNDSTKLNSYRKRSYFWLVIDKKHRYQNLNLHKVYEDENYMIYNL